MENSFYRMPAFIRLLPVVALYLCLNFFPAKAEEYVVVSDATWPPLEYLDENKNIVGYSIDYIKAVAEASGFAVNIRNKAWDGIFAALQTGQADIISSSVTITDKRKRKIMDFSEPYCEVRQFVVVPLDSPIQTMEALAGKKVGGQIGTTGLIETLPKANVDAIVKTYDEIGLAFEDLAKGNLDAVICDEPVAQYYVTKKTEHAKKFKVGFAPSGVEYYGFAVKKGNVDLLNKLNYGIKAVKEKGLDKTLSDKWFNN